MDERNFTTEDIARNRVWAALGYLLFFLPLIKCKHSPLGKYCANQGLLLLIVHVLVRILFSIFGGIPLVGWLFRLVGGLCGFALLLVGVLCMVQLLSNDRVCQLPFIGEIKLIR
ncbi:MAG: hypothetical protein IJ466_02490 [Clostridia bacterium]|nr:hypothetical protein [Clostridia bacterium]